MQSVQMRLQTVLAPQMRQSLEFLQAPLLELQSLVRRELETNPVLEEGPDDHTPIELEAARAEVKDPDGQLEFGQLYGQLASLDDEWGAYFQQGSSGGSPGEASDRHQRWLESLAGHESLQEHLRTQLGLLELDPQDRGAAELLVGFINDDGYLNATLGELAETSPHDLPRLERVLARIQDLDPVGVGARDLKECLLIQLTRLGKAGGPEAELVRNHLEALGRQDYAAIAAAMGRSVSDVIALARFIGTLEPKPGRGFSGEEAVAVVPELFVQKVGDEYTVTMNNDRLPRLRISKQYRAMLEDPATSEEARAYIRDKVRAGVFVIRSIGQRQDTVLNIAKEIVRIQRGFFDEGVSRLRPLIMADVARTVGIHETTVSRAIANKYMQTPRGVFEMKYFFSPGVKTADGGSVSTESIKEALARLVEAEDAARPLSDQDLAGRLREQGYPIARRTVAKYREELGIPPSHERKM